jgi:hypothetical protein
MRRATAIACGIIATLLGQVSPGVASPASQQLTAESIYREGTLPSGTAVRAKRDIGGQIVSMEGAAVACANCHKRSGLGSIEGHIVSPPITGKYLFRLPALNAQDLTMPHVATFRAAHPPFTRMTLARAIREGIDPDGHVLNNLMPRFELSDAQMALLTDYLETLSPTTSAGVDSETLHFATVITPDVEPTQRQAMLSVLTQFFADQGRGEHLYFDGKLIGHAAEQGFADIPHLNTQRKWKLHVWELSGAADSWEQQLRSKLAAQPVFALLAGLGSAHWAPIHHFCEEQAVPCLFPNLDVPVLAEQDFYPLYYSKGVFLEAGLMADALRVSLTTHRLQRVIQIFRAGDAGVPGAADLRRILAPSGTAVETRQLPAITATADAAERAATLAKAVSGVTGADALVLWLRAADLAALPSSPPPGVSAIASGLMGGLERAPLGAAWRPVTRLSYPFDLPQNRALRMQLPLQWFTLRKVDVVDERIQSDTYLACVILAGTLNRMSDAYVRDYLVETIEDILGKRPTNAYYPRLNLAPGQRFASKGGFVAHFAGSEGTALDADGDWISPPD